MKLQNGSWVEVFRAGTHKDSSGTVRTFTTEDIDKIVSTYNDQPEGQRHEAPITIGHPVENAPAWGWIKALKRQGEIMLAQVDKLVPEFQEWVEKHLFEKRSISLYPDGKLRHIGWLGAMPPAVKGLSDAVFNSNDTDVQLFEFQEEKPPSPRAARAAKYNIRALEGKGHDTIPAVYAGAGLTEESFADPVNLRFPIHKEYMPSVLASWSRDSVQQEYTEQERQIIVARLLKAALAHGFSLTPYRWAYSDPNTYEIIEKISATKKGEAILAAVKKDLKISEFLEVPAELLNKNQLVKVVTGQIPVPKQTVASNQQVVQKYEDTRMDEQQVSTMLQELVTWATETFGEEVGTQINAKVTELQAKFKPAPAEPGADPAAGGTAMSETDKKLDAALKELAQMRAHRELMEDNAFFTEQHEKYNRLSAKQQPLFMAAMGVARQVTSFDFSDGTTTVKKSGTDIIKDFVLSFEEGQSFTEQGGKDRVDGGGTPQNSEFSEAPKDRIDLNNKALKYQEEQAKAGKTVSYKEALNHVSMGGQ